MQLRSMSICASWWFGIGWVLRLSRPGDKCLARTLEALAG
jgi:hypothetical protein